LTVAEFVDRYYRRDRLMAEPGRRERIIADREDDMREQGSALISRHDSVTGEMVVIYSPHWRPRHYVQWLATTDGESAEPEHFDYGDGPEDW
jgi:hypothetical protein